MGKLSFFASRDVQDLYRDAAGTALRGRAEAIDRGDAAGADRWSAALFGYAERARSRALLDLMTANGGAEASDLPADLVRRWRSAGAAVALAQDRLAAAPRDSPARVGLRQVLADAQQRLGEVEDELRTVQPRFWATIDPQAPVRTLTEVAAALPAATVLLHYLVGRTDLLVWAITRDGIAAADHRKGRNRLTALAGRLVEACAAGQDDPRLAAELSELLLEPVRDTVAAAGALFVVPSGPLLRLPMTVLRWNGSPLGRTFPVTVRAGRDRAAWLRGPARIGREPHRR